LARRKGTPWEETMQTRLLLLSNSTTHGRGYLDHAEQAIRAHFQGARRLLFVPFALADQEGYAARAVERFQRLGFAMQGLQATSDPAVAVEACDGIFVGGGNTFRLLKTVQQRGLIEPIRRRALAGMPFMGASAGTNLACPTVRTTNDMPIVEPASLSALGLVPFQINPHYLDPAPDSTHMGETRETRLREFLEENVVPVVGLREGCWLRVDGARCVLEGPHAARLFARGREPWEVEPGSDVGAELASRPS
jgi:dipeptidase E